MNQVAGPFMPQQPTAFAFNPAYSHAQTTPQHTTSTPSHATAQAFTPGPLVGYHNQHGRGGRNHGAVAGGYMMSPVAGQHQQYPYTSVPYSQPVPAQADFRQSHSASPQRQVPDAVVNSSKQQTPPTKYPMAAPPLPHSPASSLQAASNNAASSPSTPQSLGSQNREQQRVTVLLDINVELLQEVNRLQAEGKGGAITPQQQAQLKAHSLPFDLASPEYIDVLRQVQAILSYLTPAAQNDKAKMPKGPTYMSPPQHMPQLQPKYDQLKELFPDWSGNSQRVAQSSASPRPNGLGLPPPQT